jgi:hypothetical protein
VNELRFLKSFSCSFIHFAKGKEGKIERFNTLKFNTDVRLNTSIINLKVILNLIKNNFCSSVVGFFRAQNDGVLKCVINEDEV